MGKGKVKKRLPADHPDKHVRRLVRKRVDLDPNVVPVLTVFLQMLKDRYDREKAKVLGRSSGLDPSHFSPLADRFQRLSDSVSTIATDLLRPHPVVEYEDAVAVVMGLIEADGETIGTPAAGTPAFSRETE